MVGLLDAVVSLGGLVIPPVFDFIKKKFVPAENDTVESTAGTLATTKPEVLPEYVKAISELKKSEVEYFNRDVCGVPSAWVVNLRASIRPVGVMLAFGILILMTTGDIGNVDGIRLSCESVLTSWFGSRITLK